MAGLMDALNSAKLALSAQQLAIQVTGHNIANVNTPGYSDQVPDFTTTIPYSSRPGQIGTGVTISEITRQFDQFLQRQITDTGSNSGRLAAEDQALQQVQSVFNESSGAGLNSVLSSFWSSWQDLANNPQGIPERTAVEGAGQQLVDTFNSMSSQLNAQRTAADQNVVGTVSDINQLTSQIAVLNGQISRAEVGGLQNANDLRDQRDQLIQQLAQKVDVNYVEGKDNMVSVFVAQGKPLVSGTLSYELSADMNAQGYHDVNWSDNAGTKADIGGEIQGGSLKGYLDLRDSYVPKYLDSLNELAASVVTAVNRQNAAGYGLDGTTGNNFFAPLVPVSTTTQNTAGLTTFTEVGSGNTGDASIDAGTVTDRSQITGNDYEIRFKSFVVNAGNDTLNLTSSNGTDTVTLTNSTGQTGASLAADLQTQLNASSVLTGGGADTFTVTYDAPTDKFTIGINNGKTVAISTAASTAAGILGFTTDPTSAASITSDSAASTDTYDIVDTTTGTTLSAGVPYTSGSAISFDGVSVVISNGSGGGPENGDVFGVKFTRQAAQNMSLSTDVLGSVDKIAAAQTSAGLPGDNTNALAIGALQNTLTMSGNQASFDSYYNGLVGQVGSDTQQVDQNNNLQSLLASQLQNQRDSVSGVSLDEELTNLLKYQHAYEGAAKVVTVVDELLTSLMQMVP